MALSNCSTDYFDFPVNWSPLRPIIKQDAYAAHEIHEALNREFGSANPTFTLGGELICLRGSHV